MTDKYKVSEKKAFKVKVKEGSNNQEVEYEITVEECAMDYTGDYKTDTVVTIDGKKKKVGDTTGTPAACKLKGKVKRGFMSDSVELEELDNVKIESGEKDVSIKGFNKGFHITWIAVTVVVVIGLVWWFIASRKEDKEEESL